MRHQLLSGFVAGILACGAVFALVPLVKAPVVQNPFVSSGAVAPNVEPQADALHDELDALRGRVVALEANAMKVAEAIEMIVPRLPPVPPTAEEIVARVAAMAGEIDAAGVRLPAVEAAGGSSQETVRVLIDPRCPYCRQGHPATLALAAEGRARIAYMPIGLLGPDSQAGAIAILTVSALDPQAGAALLDRLMTLSRPSDGPAIAEATLAVLAQAGRTQEEYDRATAQGQTAHETILKAYSNMKVPTGVPVYLRGSGAGVRGALGFRDAGDLRRMLGY